MPQSFVPFVRARGEALVVSDLGRGGHRAAQLEVLTANARAGAVPISGLPTALGRPQVGPWPRRRLAQD